MNGYGQFCPVAQAAGLLGERWTFLIIRELLSGSVQFNDIHRGVPRMSRTLLSRRLRMLVEAGLVRRRRARGGRIQYELTTAGQELQPLIDMLGNWGRRWLDAPVESEELDPGLLIWELRRTSGYRQLANREVNVRFDFPDHPEFNRNLWRIQPDGRIEIRGGSTGGGADLEVRAAAKLLADVWLGRESMEDALAAGRIEVRGDPGLARRFAGWLGRCPYASVQPA